MDPKRSRGWKNNNPGNIRRREDVKWQGEVPDSTDIDKDFEVFVAPEWGIRAIVKQLRTYLRRDDDGDLTIREVITTYAPHNENDTTMYINSVAKKTNKTPDDPINMFDTFEVSEIVKAIISVELGGQPYPDALIMKGVAMGLE